MHFIVSIPRLEFWPFVLPRSSPTSLLVSKFQFPGWNSGRLCASRPNLERVLRQVSIPRLEFWPFVPGSTLIAGGLIHLFQFPGWNSGRLCDARPGPKCWPPLVSIPRLEFWPFVHDIVETTTGEWVMVSIPRLEFWPFVLCQSLWARPSSSPVSIPRLEFWPFVPRVHAALGAGTLGFNSPVGILAVCAANRRPISVAAGRFQFPGWNSGRLCHPSQLWRRCLKGCFNSPVGILAVCAQIKSSPPPPRPRFNSPVGILAVCALSGDSTIDADLAFQFPGWNSGRLCDPAPEPGPV